MKNYWLFFALLCSSWMANAQELKTQVKNVTVYRAEAYVQREGKMPLKAGEQTIVLTGLPEDFDMNSIRIYSKPAFQILDIRPSMRTAEHDSLKQRSIRLEKAYSLKVDQHKSNNTELEILKTEERVLMQNTQYGGQQNGLTSTQLQQNMLFLGNQLRELRSKMKSKQEVLDGIAVDINKLKYQIVTLRNKRSKTERTVEARVNVEVAGSYSVSVNYQHPTSGWRPFYELKAGMLSEPIQLVAKGLVYQQSGEDWDKVQLTLSTAEPRKGNAPPILTPFELTLGVPYRPRHQAPPQYVAPKMLNTLQGIVYDQRSGEAIPFAQILGYNSKGQNVAGTTTDVDGSFVLSSKEGLQRVEVGLMGYSNYSSYLNANTLFLEIPLQATAIQLEEVAIARGASSEMMYDVSEDVVQNMPSKSLAGMAQTTYSQILIQREPTNVQYAIRQPQDVGSNGEEASVVLRELSIPSFFTYRAFPEFEDKAFLFAEITQWESLDLLSGEAALYIQDQYLGKTQLNTATTSDSLTIALGRDEGVQLKREAIAIEQSKSIFGNKVREERAYQITIRNTKNEPISVEVFDRLPVSRNPDVVVEAEELNGAERNEATGELKWVIQVPAMGSSQVSFRYSVKYPKGKAINLPQ